MDKKRNLINNQNSFLIDSSILVSAFSQKEKKERRIIAAKLIELGIDYACIAQQNLIEFTNIMLYSLKSQNSKEILEIIKDFQSIFNVLQYSKDSIFQAIELAIYYKIDFNDVLLAQTMLNNNIRLIYTENTKDFNKIPGIKAISPFTDKKIIRLCQKIKKTQSFNKK
jgi:predicted nucleic acid-binding protein